MKTRLLRACPSRWRTRWTSTTFPDERLELIFTCCHPALALEAQVALTLRALGGLTTEEIARAFLVSRGDDEAPADAGEGQDQDDRHPVQRSPPTTSSRTGCAAVLAVVYLIFNEGYGGRVDLAAEAIRLGRMLAALMPDEPEVARAAGADAAPRRASRGPVRRRRARAARRSGPRRCWDHAQIAAGRAGARPRGRAARPRAVRRSRRRSPRCRPTTAIDWPEVAALYGELARLTGSPVVELNRAVAVAEVEGPDAALALVDALDLDDYQYFHSTRADLLRRLGRADEARAAYRRALELATAEPERRFLERRLAEL